MCGGAQSVDQLAKVFVLGQHNLLRIKRESQDFGAVMLRMDSAT